MVNHRFPARQSSDVKSSRNKLLQRQPSRVRSRNLAFDASFIISVGDPTSNVTINPLTPKDHYRGRTAPLASKRCILYIYSTNTGTEYFKHGIYCPFFFFSSKCSLFHNSNLFGSCFNNILYTECAKI